MRLRKRTAEGRAGTANVHYVGSRIANYTLIMSDFTVPPFVISMS